jgi:homoserine dehydrogenase
VREIGIGLLGVGSVGAGVLKIYAQHRADLEARAGCGLRIVAAVARDVALPRAGLEPMAWPLTADPNRVLADPAVSLVVEVIGGLEPARTYVLRAIEAGKHVVTANKALLATHGTELFGAARRRGVLLGFEAAVAGGVPIIGALRNGLAANRILSLYGIVNGTSNFILTKMTDEGRDFAEALREAQAAGYAEADPTLDIEGIDSAHKLQILASLAFRTQVDLKDIHTVGIARLEATEIAYARELGYRVKLLAIAKTTDGALEARVHPTLIPAGSPLAAVSGAFNAIFVTGDAAGDQMFYGRGAGQMPTASAVWSDAIEIARRIAHQHVTLAEDFPLGGERRLPMRPMSEVRSAYYLRVMAQDRPGVLSQVAGILGRHDISIATVIQKGRARARAVPIVMLTHEAVERNLAAALEEIDRLGVVALPTVLLRGEAPEGAP